MLRLSVNLRLRRILLVVISSEVGYEVAVNTAYRTARVCVCECLILLINTVVKLVLVSIEIRKVDIRSRDD